MNIKFATMKFFLYRKKILNLRIDYVFFTKSEQVFDVGHIMYAQVLHYMHTLLYITIIYRT